MSVYVIQDIIRVKIQFNGNITGILSNNLTHAQAVSSRPNCLGLEKEARQATGRASYENEIILPRYVQRHYPELYEYLKYEIGQFIQKFAPTKLTCYTICIIMCNSNHS